MNREDFCKLLVEAKKDEGITTTEVSFRMRLALPSIVRLEKGRHNFQVYYAIKYISILGRHIMLTKDAESIDIISYDDVLGFFEKMASKVGSHKALVDIIGCAPSTMYYIRQKSTTVSIDTFLKALDVLGYEISIIKNDSNNEQE